MLGLGMIGGSVARAAVSSGMAVRAWTPRGVGPGRAADDGITPAATLDDAVADAELVVLAAPPIACLELIDDLGAAGSRVPSDAVVTDVASTKVMIVERASRAGLRFVGGHPMAGREASGYEASDPRILVDRPWVIVPPEPSDDAAEACVARLVAACGARPVRMRAEVHDRAVAAISHLPLVLSAALTESVAGSGDWAAARSLAAGGWASMTRLARGDPAMGAGILATNAGEVMARLRELQAILAEWSSELETADAEGLEARLAGARAALADGDG